MLHDGFASRVQQRIAEIETIFDEVLKDNSIPVLLWAIPIMNTQQPINMLARSVLIQFILMRRRNAEVLQLTMQIINVIRTFI